MEEWGMIYEMAYDIIDSRINDGQKCPNLWSA